LTASSDFVLSKLHSPYNNLMVVSFWSIKLENMQIDA